jgi:hypothetical protein
MRTLVQLVAFCGAAALAACSVKSVTFTPTQPPVTIGGTISAFDGVGLVLTNNGHDDLAIAGNGAFTFATPLERGTSYAIEVKTQPSAPTQMCSVTNGTGTAGDEDVTGVQVSCRTAAFSLGGTVTGLAGAGLVLQNNGGDNLAVNADGTFSFTTPVPSSASYDVTVAMQPSLPTQVCTVTNGTGTVNASSVMNVDVTCVTRTFTVGGTVTGLLGSGLVVRDNGGDDLAVRADGSFTFSTPVASGSMFAVTVLTQPAAPSQTCTVAGGSGTVGGGNVTSIAINCTTQRFTMGGTISGLVGTVTLQNNGGDDLDLTSSGTFAFSTPVPSGTTYAVTVKTQPTLPSQTCTVAAGAGTVTNADITDIVVTCTTNRFRIGGTLSGLATGNSITLRNNGGDDLVRSTNGSFTFATQVASGQPYAVTVVANPASPISQTCTVTSGTGLVAGSDVTNVQVTCTTNAFTIGGTVSGLTGTGLVLQDNGGDNLAIAGNGTFAFLTPLASGATYAVTVKTQPSLPTQACTVTTGTGTVGGSNVVNVDVRCVTSTFTIGGTVTGLLGSGLVLQDNGGDNLAISADGRFTFATPIASGSTFAVTVLTSPAAPSQTCTVSGGTGTVGGGNVTSVAINCTTNRYMIGGTISGLVGTVTLQNNGGDDRPVTSNGTFAFATPVLSGTTYTVTVKTQPTLPSQTCTVTAGAGTVTNADVTNVVVTCTTNRFRVGGTLSGLAAGNSITLRDNGGDDLVRSANGSFTFTTPVTSGQPYAVTVVANPASPISQTCTVTNGAGLVAGSDIANVQVTCTTNAFTIGGTVSGLTGTGLVLRDNGGDDLAITSNGTFTFATRVASGGTYNVTIRTQPTGQPCTVTAGSGTVGASNVTSVRVTCGDWSTSLFPIAVPSSTIGAGDLDLDNNGDLLVVALTAGAIVRVSHLTGAQTTVATGISAANDLRGVTYRAANDMIYTNTFGGQIFAVTPTGAVTPLATVSQLNALTIAPPSFGSFGGFIIGVTQLGSVVAVNPANGAITTITATAGAGSDLTFAPDGTLYICGGTTVRTVTAAGVVMPFATGFVSADGITVTPDGGRMFIADSGNSTVRQVTIPGAVVTTFGSAAISGGFAVGGIVAASGNTLIVMTQASNLTLIAFTY